MRPVKKWPGTRPGQVQQGGAYRDPDMRGISCSLKMRSACLFDLRQQPNTSSDQAVSA